MGQGRGGQGFSLSPALAAIQVQEFPLPLPQRLREIQEGFERPFWVANCSELFERLSYYAAFAVLARYLNESLGFSTQNTSRLTSLFGGFVWFMAVFGGAVADRLGFRRALSLAYLILSFAYFMMGSLGAAWMAPLRAAVPLQTLVIGVLVLPALGMALVKPCVAGTTAHASKENVRSLGYSIYYTLVNIGGAAGPIVASFAHRHLGVENVFRVSALSVFVMFFAVLFFFRSPKMAAEKVPSIGETLRNFGVVVGNLRFLLFLLLFAGYYVVYWQEFITLPLYIAHHVDKAADTDMMLSAGALTVISLQLIVTWLSRRIKPLTGIALGTLISGLAWLILAVWPSFTAAVATLIVVALGEITMSPRYYEYVSRLAPEGQQGTYLGFAFMPIGVGSIVAGLYSSFFYSDQSTHLPLFWAGLSLFGALNAACFWLYGRFLAPKTVNAE
jgi:dipeptide/tripeptide permease